MLGVLLTACNTNAGDPPVTIEDGGTEIVMHSILSQPASGFENEFVRIHQDSAKNGDVVVFEAERVTDATVEFMIQGKQTHKEYSATFVNNDDIWDTYEFTMPDEDIIITSWLDNFYLSN